MKREYSNERPPLYERDKNEPAKVINFGIREETEGEFKYSYYSVSVRFGQWDYSGIVNAIVSAEYPSARMQAVTNNYLQETDLAKLIDLLRTTQNFNKLRKAMEDWLSSRDKEVVEEYTAMQEWRKMAKETAREVLKL